MESNCASASLSSKFLYECIKYFLIIQNVLIYRPSLQASALSVPRTSYHSTFSQQKTAEEGLSSSQTSFIPANRLQANNEAQCLPMATATPHVTGLTQDL